MTDTLERPAVDEHDLKALDFEISCDVEECEQRADWWLVCLACGAHTPVCEPHRRTRVLRAEALGARGLVVCPECHLAVRASVWRSLFAFVPIGRT